LYPPQFEDSGRDYSTCGANDCQDPNVTQENISQYVPASETTLYIMIGVLSGLVLIAIGIHSLLTRDIDPTLEAQDKNVARMENELKNKSATENENGNRIVSSAKNQVNM